MSIQREDGRWERLCAELSAQQANLIRVVLRRDPSYLNHASQRDPVTGKKAVPALSLAEVRDFGERFSLDPVGCIRNMNEAVAQVSLAARKGRYLKAAVELEIRMDRCEDGSRESLMGIPGYIQDGYTDLGLLAVSRRREQIRVDKGGLVPHLLSSRALALDDLSREDRSRDLTARLRRMAQSLRTEIVYEEGEPVARTAGGTVLLSECVENGMVGSRHLSILMQLRLQESGISSRLVKGGLRLYGLKTRHAWNVVTQDNAVALVDVTFAEGDMPFVIVGSSAAELYGRAERVNRSYRESPDTANHYTVMAAGA